MFFCSCVRAQERLALVAGASPEDMKLSVLNTQNQLVALLEDDSRTLESYQLENYATLYVDVSSSTLVRQLQDVSQVEKFELTEDEYNQRQNSFRKFKQNNPQMFAEAEARAAAQAAAQAAIDPEEGAEAAAAIRVGMRCEMSDDAALPKRGVVSYVGKVDFAPGYWVGVTLDEPTGKHDGTVKGRAYFQAEPNHGAFKKAALLLVGDYPELDPFADEM